MSRGHRREAHERGANMEDLQNDDLLPTIDEFAELGTGDIQQTTYESVGDADSDAEADEIID
jgi:hypothetical protein